jgi:hypothetical protein
MTNPQLSKHPNGLVLLQQKGVDSTSLEVVAAIV